MSALDQIPESFKRVALKPNAFTFAWKRRTLEKLFEELLSSNIAIKSGEAWVVEGETLRAIPLKNGEIKLFEWNLERKKNEDWYDFVERSTKQTLELIGGWDLEKNVRLDLINKIWYHFEFEEEE